jgi:hypothetical protein
MIEERGPLYKSPITLLTMPAIARNDACTTRLSFFSLFTTEVIKNRFQKIITSELYYKSQKLA